MAESNASGVIEPGRLYTAVEARRRLGIGRVTWRELCAEGLHVIRRGRQAYVFGDDLLQLFRDAGGKDEPH